MTITRLEHLPTELWLFLFGYFDLLDILRSFSFLNRKIDSLIRSQYTSFQLHIRDGTDLKQSFESTVASFSNIVSVCIETRLHKEHALQLARVLSHQSSLSYVYFKHVQASSICLCLAPFAHQLTSLTIHRTMSAELLNEVCRLPNLHTLEIDYTGCFEGGFPFCLPSNITRLVLGASINHRQLNLLLVIVPHIHSLTMTLRHSNYANVIGRRLPLLRNLTLHLEKTFFRVIQELRTVAPVNLNKITLKGNGLFELTRELDSSLWEKLLMGITIVQINLLMNCYIESNLENYVLDDEDICLLREIVEREEQKFSKLGISLVYPDVWDEPDNLCILKTGTTKM